MCITIDLARQWYSIIEIKQTTLNNPDYLVFKQYTNKKKCRGSLFTELENLHLCIRCKMSILIIKKNIPEDIIIPSRLFQTIHPEV